MSTAGFDSVLFLSEGLFNKTLRALYDASIIQHFFAGSFESGGGIPGVALIASYELTLDVPQVELTNARSAGVRLRVGCQGRIKLCFRFSTGQERCLVDTQINAAASGDVRLGSENQAGKTFFVLDLTGISGLNIELGGSPVPEKYREVIRRVLERLLIVNFREHLGKIPITTALRRSSLGMWPITESEIRVVAGSKEKALALAFTTEPNSGSGNAARLSSFLDGRDFGVALGTAFIVQTLDLQWRRGQIPTRFATNGKPAPTGPVRLKVFNVAIRDKAIALSVNAVLETDLGNQEVWIHGALEVKFEKGRFKVDIKDASLELPWAIHLLGFIVFKAYYILIAIVLAELAGGLADDVGEPLLEALLNSGEFDVLYKGEIPRTGLSVSVTLAEMSIVEDGLVVTGNVKLEPTAFKISNISSPGRFRKQKVIAASSSAEDPLSP